MLFVFACIIAAGFGAFIKAHTAMEKARARRWINNPSGRRSTPEEVDQLVADLNEWDAHRLYTQAAVNGQLPPNRVPMSQKVGGYLLAAELGHSAFGLFDHHDHR